MRAIKRWSVGLALGMLIPGVARADQKDFLNFCTPGEVKACASVQVITFWNGSNTEVTIRIRNQAAWSTGLDNTGGSFINAIGIIAPDVGTVNTGSFSVGIDGGTGVTKVGSAESDWAVKEDVGFPGAGLGGGIELVANTGNPAKNGAIQGCIISSNPTRYFQTCDGTGFVVFSFVTSGNWSANNVVLAWKYQGIGDNGLSLECRTDDVLAEHTCTGDVIPEPITMVLLGTGLAGLGGAGLIRRRMKNGDVKNA